MTNSLHNVISLWCLIDISPAIALKYLIIYLFRLLLYFYDRADHFSFLSQSTYGLAGNILMSDGSHVLKGLRNLIVIIKQWAVLNRDFALGVLGQLRNLEGAGGSLIDEPIIGDAKWDILDIQIRVKLDGSLINHSSHFVLRDTFWEVISIIDETSSLQAGQFAHEGETIVKIRHAVDVQYETMIHYGLSICHQDNSIFI